MGESDPDRRDPERELDDAAPWDARILARIDAGVDGASIEENLRRTPQERLERMQQMLRFLEQAKRDGRPADP